MYFALFSALSLSCVLSFFFFFYFTPLSFNPIFFALLFLNLFHPILLYPSVLPIFFHLIPSQFIFSQCILLVHLNIFNLFIYFFMLPFFHLHSFSWLSQFIFLFFFPSFTSTFFLYYTMCLFCQCIFHSYLHWTSIAHHSFSIYPLMWSILSFNQFSLFL